MTEFTNENRPAGPAWVARWHGVLERHRWVPFVLPFMVFMLFAAVEPKAAGEPTAADSADSTMSVAERVAVEEPRRAAVLSYPVFYTLRIAATLVAILLVWPVWRTGRREIHWGWAITAGLVGVGLWIAICQLQWENRVLQLVGLDAWASWSARPAYNPYRALGATPIGLTAFLTVRLMGLAILVPLVEEFFLRGFLMRFVDRADWWTMPLGQVSWRAAVAATVYGVAAHPAEMLAAAVWFSLITWLYARTRSLWTCVVAHGVTNAALGCYVLTFHDWTLW